MQKKSLLVALFCGALCLTGCLKNEESESVKQIRLGKAEELKSLAALNNAKAQAEIIYANAEATIANAEAKLREAQANLVNAKAETERVRAELLKVQVQLAEVKVEEEKVKLQMKEAELEQKLAEVEAAVAKADAEKQLWINALENAMAQAEVDAINNAEAILKAEEKLEEYVLTLEKAHADSAKKAAIMYFEALNTTQDLQKDLIRTKATKALVEAGALQIREAIYYQIDQIDEQIAKNEALVAALKEYQTLTPEEAEEALIAARTTLNEAYNEYKAAMEVKTAAATAQTELEAKTADYTQEWKKNFKDDFKKFVDYGEYPTLAWSKDYYGGHKLIDDVQYYGVFVADEDKDDTNDAFIPLWTTLGSAQTGYRSWAAEKIERQRYPDIDVYEGENTDFIVLTTTTITPAKIDFEKVNDVLDGLVAEAKAAAQEKIDKEEKVNIPARIKRWQGRIDEFEDELDLHTKYVNERKAAVKAAEDEYIAAFKASKQRQKDIDGAWLAFQEYMLVHHDADRMLYISQSASAKAYNAAKDAKTTAQTNFNAAKAALTESEGALKTAREKEAKAEGEYRTATAAGAAGVPPATAAAWTTAQNNWNPKFDAEKATAYDTDDYGKGQKWRSGTSPVEYAAIAQNNLLNAQDSLKKWQAVEYNAQMVLWRTAAGTAAYTTAQTNYNTAHGQVQVYVLKVTRCTIDANNAESDYTLAKKNYDAAMGVTEKEKWNPDFMGFLKNAPDPNESITFPSNIDTTGHIKKVNNKWTKAAVVAGDSQGALIDAVIEYRDNYARVNVDTYGKPAVKTEKALLDEANVKEVEAKTEYENATKKLIAALKHVTDWTTINLSKEKVSDYLDENALTLWGKYVDAKEAQQVDLNKAWNKVDSLYYYNPNHIDNTANPDYPTTWTTNANLFPDANDAQYSWWRSSFYVDYEAQMLDKETAEYYPIALKVFRQVKHHGEYVYVEDENGNKVKAENVWYWDYTLPEATFKFSAEEHIIPVPKCWASPSYKIEKYQSFIDGKDEYLAEFKVGVAAELNTLVEKIEAVRPAVNAYQAHEKTYLAWIDEIGEAEDAVNEAKKAEFDAKLVKNDAQAKYDAAEAVANEGMWVYDPDAKLYMKVYNKTSKPNKNKKGEWEDGFTWITIADEIENLEGSVEDLYITSSALGEIVFIDGAATTQDVLKDFKFDESEIKAIYGLISKSENAAPGKPESIAELTFAKKVLEQALKQGKVGLQIIIDAFDEEIAELEEQIQVYTKIAETYKSIMNAYLGIADEAIVPDEEEIEGDDEE